MHPQDLAGLGVDDELEDPAGVLVDQGARNVLRAQDPALSVVAEFQGAGFGQSGALASWGVVNVIPGRPR